MDFFVKKERILFATIILWTAFVSFWSFRTNPPYWFDEGIYHQVVHNLANYGVMGVRLTPVQFSDASLISVGYPVFYPAVFAFKLFGDSVTVLRLTAICFLLGLVVAVYALTRQLYGAKTALVSTLLLSFFSPLYGNGKSFLGEVPGMFYFVSALALFIYAEKADKRKFLVLFLSGIFFGLAASSKPNFLVILPSLAVGIVWKWRQFLASFRGRRVVLVTLVGLAAAMMLWFFTQFGVHSSAGRILAHYSNPYYIKDIWPVIFSNLRRFVTESTPAYFFGMLLVIVSFVLVRLWRRQPLQMAEIVLLAFVGAISIFYVRTAGWYRYFFPAHVALFVLFPAGLEYLVRFGCKTTAKYANVVLSVILTCIFLAELSVMYTERFHTAPDAPTEMDSTLVSLSKKDAVFFYSLPQLASRYPSENFYQFMKMSDYLSLGSENVALFKEGKFSYVIMEDKPIDFSIPGCYNRETEIRKILVFKRNNKASCL